MENSYQRGRKIVKSIFMPLYSPTVINKEIIPEEGPIIFCGNHLHVWDQVPVICSTKRTIHWMAKKEYFESKMSWMYKMFECIPVDRYNNPHESKEIAEEYLKKGDAVGIFPEGTRNKYYFIMKKYNELLNNKYLNILEYKCAMKELQKELQLVKNDLEKRGITNYENDDILLPFHFGAVSMAKKTNSLIIPFGITGDYKIKNNNLTLNFGNPISVANMDLEEANSLLRNNVKKLVLENRNNQKL